MCVCAHMCMPACAHVYFMSTHYVYNYLWVWVWVWVCKCQKNETVYSLYTNVNKYNHDKAIKHYDYHTLYIFLHIITLENRNINIYQNSRMIVFQVKEGKHLFMSLELINKITLEIVLDSID